MQTRAELFGQTQFRKLPCTLLCSVGGRPGIRVPPRNRTSIQFLGDNTGKSLPLPASSRLTVAEFVFVPTESFVVMQANVGAHLESTAV